MKKYIFILSAVACLLLTSCGATMTRESEYPNLYTEKPISILVMPPINNTTNVEAKELLYTSINTPLIEKGYYVVSPHLALEILKNESAYDAEMFVNSDISMFGNVFGADVVIFSTIEKWQKLGLGIETEITYTVRSTKTNEVLFERACDLYLDLTGQNGNNNSGSLLVGLIRTAVTDHIEAARKCNYYIFRDLPCGKYSIDYLKDQKEPVDPKNVRMTVR